MQREKLGSRLGFILLSAGCAIGVGNVWKFPYMVGQNGGGMFVLIYLFFLTIMGIPVMTMEFAMGRASQKSPVCMYKPLEPKGSKWHIHGYFAMIGNWLLLMFYSVVSGWMLKFFVDTAMGKFEGENTQQIAEHFNIMLSNPTSMIFYTAIVLIIACVVCSIGLQSGLERITKVMMIMLIIIMIALAINSVFMPGSSEGLHFYLLPDIAKMKEVGTVNVIVGAMNQAFFTLSLGIGAMAIFGSYIDKKRSLLGESVNVAVLDTFVALASGLIIFPACFAYNIQPDSGPSLIFITLPNIFNNIPMGRLWGSLFFIFMSFASLSTFLSVFENIVSCSRDLFGWSRRKTCIINGILLFILSMPCALGFNLFSNITPFGDGSTIMDLEDFLVSNILLPVGSLIFILFCVCRYGWGWDKFTAEANAGKGIKVKNWMKFYMTFILPIIALSILIIGLVEKFA